MVWLKGEAQWIRGILQQNLTWLQNTADQNMDREASLFMPTLWESTPNFR